MEFKKLTLGVLYTITLAISFMSMVHGFVGAFFIGGRDTALYLVFLCLSRFAWFPLTVLSIATRRIAASLMAACVISGLIVECFIRHSGFTPRIEVLWLADSLGPLAITAVALWMLDKYDGQRGSSEPSSHAST